VLTEAERDAAARLFAEYGFDQPLVVAVACDHGGYQQAGGFCWQNAALCAAPGLAPLAGARVVAM
jgi:hypothetical protein